ncbi:MAG: hypothetical protein DRJ05_11645 [Bacteroidetes bacterium]|nr:MAG: hypothetical protein DRJ05_11645 [Bacteroidota bacterium]
MRAKKQVFKITNFLGSSWISLWDVEKFSLWHLGCCFLFRVLSAQAISLAFIIYCKSIFFFELKNMEAI